MSPRLSIALGALLAAALATSAAAQTATPSSANSAPPHVGAQQELRHLTLVRAVDGKAVVRFGSGPLETLVVGNRVGGTAATVVEIVDRRLVLAEAAPRPDGSVVRAQIVLRQGETGGTRYVGSLDENPPVGTKPIVETPANATSRKPPVRRKPPETRQ